MTTPDRLTRRTFLVLAAAGTAVPLGSQAAVAQPGSTIDSIPRYLQETNESDTNETEADADNETEADADAVIGEPVDHDEWQAVVSGVDHRMPLADQSTEDDSTNNTDVGGSDTDTAMGPNRGGLTVTVALQNTGDDVLAAERRPETRLRFADQEDEAQPIMMDEPETTGRLASGEVDRRELRFRMPGDRSPPETPGEMPAVVLIIDPSEAGSTPSIVDLSEEADPVVELVQDVDDIQAFGTSVEAGEIELTPTSLELGTGLSGSGDDREIVVMGLELINNSDREQTPQSIQFELTDDTGRSYPQTEDGPGIVDDFAFDPIAASEETEGEFVYEIGETATELFFVVDYAPWGVDRRVFWQLR